MRYTSLLMLLLFSAGIVRPQSSQTPITGKVVAEDGKEGLAGVSISVKGTRRGTVTGPDGTYRLNIGA